MQKLTFLLPQKDAAFCVRGLSSFLVHTYLLWKGLVWGRVGCSARLPRGLLSGFCFSAPRSVSAFPHLPPVRFSLCAARRPFSSTFLRIHVESADYACWCVLLEMEFSSCCKHALPLWLFSDSPEDKGGCSLIQLPSNWESGLTCANVKVSVFLCELEKNMQVSQQTHRFVNVIS